MKTRYINARIYRGGKFEVGSLLVEEGRFVADGPGAAADRTVDLGGRHVVPGLVDVHVHLREPGFPHKETIATGTAAIRPSARCPTSIRCPTRPNTCGCRPT